MAEVSWKWVRSRPRLGRIDGVKMALGSREMTVEAKIHLGGDCVTTRPIGRSVELCCICRWLNATWPFLLMLDDCECVIWHDTTTPVWWRKKVKPYYHTVDSVMVFIRLENYARIYGRWNFCGMIINEIKVIPENLVGVPKHYKFTRNIKKIILPNLRIN